MKMSKLKKMSVGEILSSIEFSEAFVKDFREWCQARYIQDHQKDSQSSKTSNPFLSSISGSITNSPDSVVVPSSWISKVVKKVTG